MTSRRSSSQCQHRTIRRRSPPAVLSCCRGEMRPSCLFFLLFLLPLLVFVSGDTRALRNRLMTLAKGLPFTRWHNRMVRPPGPRPRLKRPLEDRFARAPILTRYTPLIMDEDAMFELTVKEVERVVEQPVVEYDNLQPSSLPVPLDHGWSGYELETVDLTEAAKETTTEPSIELVEIEVPDVDVVDMEDVAVALGQAGAVQLNWGQSMREAVANGLQKISIEHPAAVEQDTYQSFPSRIQTEDTQESSIEEESGSNSKEEHFHEIFEPGLIQDSWQEQDLTEDKIETFQGLRIEDNFDLGVEQPKLAPPYQGHASDFKVTDFLNVGLSLTISRVKVSWHERRHQKFWERTKGPWMRAASHRSDFLEIITQ